MELIRSAIPDAIPAFDEMGFTYRCLRDVPEIFLRETNGLCQFFEPEVLVRRKYKRIGGSIGFAIGDKILSGLDLDDALSPTRRLSLSIRIENYPVLIEFGSLAFTTSNNLNRFVSAINDMIKETVPDSVSALKELAGVKGNWISTLLSAPGGPLAHPIADIVGKYFD